MKQVDSHCRVHRTEAPKWLLISEWMAVSYLWHICVLAWQPAIVGETLYYIPADKCGCSVWLFLQNGEHPSLSFAKPECPSSPSLDLEGRYLQTIPNHIFILSKNMKVLWLGTRTYSGVLVSSVSGHRNLGLQAECLMVLKNFSQPGTKKKKPHIRSRHN